MTRIDPGALGARAIAMIDQLAAISAEDGRITRHYLSPEHLRATRLVSDWMQAAGMTAHVDDAATVHGLFGSSDDRRLLIGSHIDTVVDAGKFDGTVGVIAGILAVSELRRLEAELPFAVEVLAFGDEEGARFPSALLASSALAGRHDTERMNCSDATGLTVHKALADAGFDPDALTDMAYDRNSVIGYLEAHIEQGPVLEQVGLPLGVVTAIAGQGRYRMRVEGEAGHAGTVPMGRRRDALTAAAEMISALEALARDHEGAAMVATVGSVTAEPGAGNVIPGAVSFSLDHRAADDSERRAAFARVEAQLRAIAERRGVGLSIEKVHESAVSVASSRLRAALDSGVRKTTGNPPPHIMSGAGHDGQAMAHLTEIGMLFIRCRDGISHNPLEWADPEDIGLAIAALVETVQNLSEEGEGS